MPLKPRPGGALWIGVAGKGGSGKSVLSGRSRACSRARPSRARDRLRPDAGPGHSLGVEEPDRPLLMEAAEKPEKGPWRLKPGVGPMAVVRRYTTPGARRRPAAAARQVRQGRVVAGQRRRQRLPQTVRRMHEAQTLYGWAIVGDLPAGPRQPAAGFSPYARLYVVVVEPTSQSALTGRRVARIARGPLGADVLFVASKVTGRRGARTRRAPAGRAGRARDPVRRAAARSREQPRRGDRRRAAIAGRARGRDGWRTSSKQRTMEAA